MKYNIRNSRKQFHEQCLSHVQLKRTANGTGLDTTAEIMAMEKKYQQVCQSTFYVVIFLN